MISCPNCGGNPRFDIASQKMLCQHCGSYFDPATMPEETSGADMATVTGDYAGQPDEMQVTIYTCSQCGGELMSTDTDATAFCSYCGSHQILEERIAMQKRPQHIIPFKITKEDCKSAYAKKMKRNLFAPKDLRDPAYIDEFRGIYMPYWFYNYKQQGTIRVDGTKEHRSGNYRIIDHYDLTMDADNYYQGITHDASTSFDDNISEALAPFDTREAVPFRTPYISGFYADIPDSDKSVYENECAIIAARDAYDAVSDNFKGYSKEDVSDTQLISRTSTRLDGASSAMFPVWFLSYRKDDRVAYAAINGQTGKITADIPIDKKKYFMGAGVITLILWALLQMFNIASLRGILMSALIAAFAGGLVFFLAVNKLACDIKIRQWEKTIGSFVNPGTEDSAVESSQDAPQKKGGKKKSKKPKKPEKPEDNTGSMILMTLAMLAIAVVAGALFIWAEFGWIVCIVPVILFFMNLYAISEAQIKRGRVSSTVLCVVMEIAFLVWYFNPWYDILYYGLVLILTAVVVWCFFDALFYYNQIMTRPLPQFEKKGGSDSAN